MMIRLNQVQSLALQGGEDAEIPITDAVAVRSGTETGTERGTSTLVGEPAL